MNVCFQNTHNPFNRTNFNIYILHDVYGTWWKQWWKMKVGAGKLKLELKLPRKLICSSFLGTTYKQLFKKTQLIHRQISASGIVPKKSNPLLIGKGLQFINVFEFACCNCLLKILLELKNMLNSGSHDGRFILLHQEYVPKSTTYWWI